MDVLTVRIPLPVQFKTRKGDVTKDARIKNGYVEILGEVGRVRKRPGVVFDRDLGTGDGYFLGCVALSPSGGNLSAMIGDIIIVGDDSWDVSASAWDVGTVYYYGDWVYYAGQYWYYTGASASTAGVAPSSGSGWGNSANPNDTYDNNTNYDIDDSVIYEGVLRYANAAVTGVTPANTAVWTTTPAPSTRYRGQFANIPGYTPTGATVDAAASVGFAAFYSTVEHACPGVAPYHVWYTSDYDVVGFTVNGSQYGTAGVRPCGDPINGPNTVAVGTISTVIGP